MLGFDGIWNAVCSSSDSHKHSLKGSLLQTTGGFSEWSEDTRALVFERNIDGRREK